MDQVLASQIQSIYKEEGLDHLLDDTVSFRDYAFELLLEIKLIDKISLMEARIKTTPVSKIINDNPKILFTSIIGHVERYRSPYYELVPVHRYEFPRGNPILYRLMCKTCICGDTYTQKNIDDLQQHFSKSYIWNVPIRTDPRAPIQVHNDWIVRLVSVDYSSGYQSGDEFLYNVEVEAEDGQVYKTKYMPSTLILKYMVKQGEEPPKFLYMKPDVVANIMST